MTGDEQGAAAAESSAQSNAAVSASGEENAMVAEALRVSGGGPLSICVVGGVRSTRHE